MSGRMTIVVSILGVIVAVTAAIVTIARVVLERRIAGEIADLFAANDVVEPTVVAEADLISLPEPVLRWLRFSHVVGKERALAVRLKQEGEFRLGEGRDWMPFAAEEYYTVNPPGFIWSVTMHVAPMLTITGRERYQDGMGDIDMRLLSLFPLANKRGGGLNQGALLRYLNETMWFPSAALSPYITWEDIDENSARATMTYGGVTASASLIFDGEGRLVDMVAERYNDARDRLETWSTPIHAYGEFDGVRIPVEGEGIWRYDTGDFAYIRVRITDVDYNTSERYEVEAKSRRRRVPNGVSYLVRPPDHPSWPRPRSANLGA